MKLYAVAKGREIGVFDNWEQVHDSTEGFSGAKFKKVKTFGEGEEYVKKFKEVKKQHEQNPFKSNKSSVLGLPPGIGTDFKEKLMQQESDAKIGRALLNAIEENTVFIIENHRVYMTVEMVNVMLYNLRVKEEGMKRL